MRMTLLRYMSIAFSFKGREMCRACVRKKVLVLLNVSVVMFVGLDVVLDIGCIVADVMPSALLVSCLVRREQVSQQYNKNLL